MGEFANVVNRGSWLNNAYFGKGKAFGVIVCVRRAVYRFHLCCRLRLDIR